MGMKGFIGRRAIDSMVLIFVAILFNFFLFRLMPGDPTIALLGKETQLPSDRRSKIIDRYGLDKSTEEQFIIYLQKLAVGDMGISIEFYPRSVVDVIFGYRLFNTVILMGISIVLSFILALMLGTIAASKFKSRTDLTSIFCTLTIYSTPIFWLGMLVLYFFYGQFDLIPVAGSPNYELIGTEYEITYIFGHKIQIGALVFSWDWTVDYIHHMIGPLFCLTTSFVGGWFLIARDQLLGVFAEDYIHAARAKGLKESRVLFTHARKNAMLPMVSVFALAMTYLVAGAMLTETVFTYDGVGLLTLTAISNRDYPLLQGLFLMIAIVAILSNFAADIVYAYLDPRIRY
ncbi:MAG: ABC transporter permease [Candidatus Hodarchaeales archaeon]|jgi:peptide/nickel transport system permease protein